MSDDDNYALFPQLTSRDADTIIAALRLWQHHITGTKPDFEGLEEIATNERNGDDAMLTADEIDKLIENEINTGTNNTVSDAIERARQVLCCDFGGNPSIEAADDKLYEILQSLSDDEEGEE